MNKQFLQFTVFLLMYLTLPLNATAQKMYWLDEESDKIQRASVDGSNIEDLVTGLGTPEAIALDVSGGKMYWTDKGTDKIQRANLDGSNVEDLITGLTIPEGIALDVARGKMYWVGEDMDKIQRANLNGSHIEALVTTGNPWGITLDLVGNQMYWTDQETNKIQRANLDGSNIEDLVTIGLDVPIGIALDIKGNKMYWADRGTNKIQRANLDGSNIEDLVTAANGLDDPEDIALDIAAGKMYWVDHGTDKIQCANLDGSNIKDLVTIEGTSRLSGIALDVSPPELEDWVKLSLPAIAPVHVGATFALDLIIENVTDLSGWQADIAFNPAVLSTVSVTEGDFLSKDGGSTFFQEGNINNTTGEITGLIAARTTSGGVSGTGVLLSIIFEAQATGEDFLRFRNVKLGQSNREVMPYTIIINPIIVQSSLDVNGDGQINLLDLTLVAQNFGQTNSQADINNDGTVDILDLLAVAQNLGTSTTGLAPSVESWHLSMLNSTTIQEWIDMAYAANDGSLAFQLGIANLKHLLAAMHPDTTALLANYPNPFNPETWIPYQLARDADVRLTIYDTTGVMVRRIDLGHQTAGYYADRIKAVYWDGRNNLGESVGSGVYFYQLQAEDFSAIRKMVILK